MTDIFRCGHPRTPENAHPTGSGQFRCRECRLVEKRKWRERAREKKRAEILARIAKRHALPPALLPPADQLTTPEAIGSRNLLIAYARYYERHVKGRVANDVDKQSTERPTGIYTTDSIKFSVSWA